MTPMKIGDTFDVTSDFSGPQMAGLLMSCFLRLVNHDLT